MEGPQGNHKGPYEKEAGNQSNRGCADGSVGVINRGRVMSQRRTGATRKWKKDSSDFPESAKGSSLHADFRCLTSNIAKG